MFSTSVRPALLVAGVLVLAVLLGSRGGSGLRSGAESPPPGCLTLEGHGCWVQAVEFSPDGSLLASGGHLGDARGEVKVWEVSSGRPLVELELDPEAVYALTFSPDGRTLATGGPNATVRFWDVATGSGAGLLRGTGGNVRRVAYAGRPRHLTVLVQGDDR